MNKKQFHIKNPEAINIDDLINSLKNELNHEAVYNQILKYFSSNFFTIRPLEKKEVKMFRVVDEYKNIDIIKPESFSYNKDSKSNGRAHVAGEPVFYASDFHGTAVSEACSKSTNDIFYLSTWELNCSNLDVYQVLLLPTSKSIQKDHPHFQYSINTKADLKKIFSKLNIEAFEFLFQGVLKINDLFSVESEQYYNITSAIGYHLMNTYFFENKPIDIILYPSQKSELVNWNYAIHPRLIERNDLFIIKDVFKFRLKSKNNDGHHIEFLDKGECLGNEINWNNGLTEQDCEEIRKRFI